MNNQEVDSFKERLKEWLHEQMDSEKENMQEARQVAGINCVGYGMADGAHDAYKSVLVYIFGDEERE